MSQLKNEKESKGGAEEENLFLNMQIIDVSNGQALQIKKTISFNDKNYPLLQKIILASLQNEYVIITSKVCVRFNDRLKAISKLRKLGMFIDAK